MISTLILSSQKNPHLFVCRIVLKQNRMWFEFMVTKRNHKVLSECFNFLIFHFNSHDINHNYNLIWYKKRCHFLLLSKVFPQKHRFFLLVVVTATVLLVILIIKFAIIYVSTLNVRRNKQHRNWNLLIFISMIFFSRYASFFHLLQIRSCNVILSKGLYVLLLTCFSTTCYVFVKICFVFPCWSKRLYIN